MKSILGLLTLATALSAQSPEVHPDRRVTFRVTAPKAAQAEFHGDWMPATVNEKMTKGGDGVWSITVGPLEPSVYIYNFVVDGVTMADPVNPRMKLRARTSASMVEVPAASAQLWDATDVPHGAVEINWQKSKVLDETRWIWVYTPPGYSKDAKQRYPILYLFHGSNDIAGGWVLAGHANFILDNLIAQGKAKPMIVVMPWGHAVPFDAPRDLQPKNTQMYDDYVMSDVIPFVESKYRVLGGKQNRAVAGLSMGGGQALHIGFSHLDKFSAVGVFSSSAPAGFETRLAQPVKLSPLWIAAGRQDPVFERSQKLSELLKSKNIEHVWRPTEGVHTYKYWRQYLGEFLPLLFQR